MGDLQATLSDGNSKLGKGPDIRTFSLPPLASCPGVSSWCAGACYAKRPYQRYRETHAQWDRNLDALTTGAPLPVIPASVRAFRIHVSGDFYSAAYVRQWQRHVRRYPDVLFWAYTRNWRRKRMLRALDQLRAEPNVQLFASTDPSIPEVPPAGWRIAFVRDAAGAGPGGDDRFTGLACPEQDHRQESCLTCGYCFRGRRGNVSFKFH